MKKNSSDLPLLRVLAILGVIAFLLLFIVPTLLAIRSMRRQARMVDTIGSDTVVGSRTSGNGLLGELSSTCGGKKRLPCKPGLVCNAATDGISEGVCVKDPDAPAATALQFNEACGVGADSFHGCAAGLYCRHDAQRAGLMFCSKLSETAPFVVSMKIEGMSPEAGRYHAPAGTKATLSVQTTNVDRMEVVLSGKNLGEAKKLEGGRYSIDFTIPAGLDGELRVMAYQKTEFSSAAVRVFAE